jgi:hypothetical protein
MGNDVRIWGRAFNYLIEFIDFVSLFDDFRILELKKIGY